MNSRSVEIFNQRGLHARASAAFARTAQAYESEITVKRASMVADGKSIMDLLMLAASKGLEVEIVAEGPDEDEALNALCELVTNLFGEDE